MKRGTLVLLGLAMFIIASIRSRNKAGPSWFQQLRGWQKLVGIVAAVLVLLFLLNPEFLFLGFIGDAAFFDMMVLALSLQMHTYVAGFFRACCKILSRGKRWLGIPSPGLAYLSAVSIAVIVGAASAVQRAVQRLIS